MRLAEASVALQMDDHLACTGDRLWQHCQPDVKWIDMPANKWDATYRLGQSGIEHQHELLVDLADSLALLRGDKAKLEATAPHSWLRRRYRIGVVDRHFEHEAARATPPGGSVDENDPDPPPRPTNTLAASTAGNTFARRCGRSARPHPNCRSASNGDTVTSHRPGAIIRAEPQRVLFGFMRGQRLRHIEPRLKPGGKYELATLELRPDTPLRRETVLQLVTEAAQLNRTLGDPTAAR
jgi:hypothetical protein